MPSPAELARALHAVVEPIHNALYFTADVQERYGALGLEPRTQGYFAGRAAPMGRVTAGTVAATFFNFNPALVAMMLPAVWDVAAPGQVLDARRDGIEAMYRRIAGPTDGLHEAAELLGGALDDLSYAGRPLAAANAALTAPDEPFGAVWHHVSVLREYRGDGHVALLTASGLDPVDVLVVYAAWQGKVSRRFIQSSRVWDDVAWQAAEERLRDRGWLGADGTLTEAGRAWRDGIEADTDRLAAPPWAALGEDGSRRLYDLLRPVATAIVTGDVFPRPGDPPPAFDEALSG